MCDCDYDPRINFVIAGFVGLFIILCCIVYFPVSTRQCCQKNFGCCRPARVHDELIENLARDYQQMEPYNADNPTVDEDVQDPYEIDNLPDMSAETPLDLYTV